MSSLADTQRQMAEALPCFIWTATADGHTEFVNRRFLEYTGIPENDFAGQGWLDAVHPDDVAPTMALWHQCVAEQRPYKTEFRFLHQATNTWRWHHVAALPCFDDHGALIRWYGISTDIHDTRLAQQAVDDAHRDLRWMLELQSLESKVLDSVSAAQGLEAIFRKITISVEALLPGTLCSISPDDGTLSSRRTTPAGTTAEGKPARTARAIPVLGSDGSQLATLVLDTTSPEPGDERQTTLIDRACQLVRVAIERTRQQEMLRESEARFRAAARASGDVLWDYDPISGAIWYSDGMMRLFGRNPATDPALQSGRDASRYIHPDDRDKAVEYMAQATENGNSWQLEYRFERADGSYANIINRAVVLCNPDGTPHRILGSMTDITHQKLLEEQLRRSQRLEAIGQLTGGLAHDFNNLLTIILGNADQIADEAPEGSEHRELAQGVKKAARKGAELIRSLLAFSRQQVLMARPVQLSTLVAGMQTLLRNALGDAIHLRMELSRDVSTIFVDPGQLETALLNLVFNARDAMPHGGELVLGARTQHVAGAPGNDPDFKAGSYTILEVRDTGCGMCPDTIRHVFEPFFTTKEIGKGNGLGLSMVYGFVKQSNGQVVIESQPNEGTTVRLYFPCHGSPPAPARTTFDKARQALPQGAEPVLVVEDDPIVLQFLVSQLRRLGYDVSSATSGRQALELLTSGTFRLLFTDMVMPGGMSGLELANVARAAQPELAVLISSGNSNEHFSKADRTPEGYWLLAKPYLRADLAMRVRQALSGTE